MTEAAERRSKEQSQSMVQKEAGDKDKSGTLNGQETSDIVQDQPTNATKQGNFEGQTNDSQNKSSGKTKK